MSTTNDDTVKFPLVKPLPHQLFDRNAMRVYNRLRSLNHTTYFVGGCIRDLLLGKIPKDFDIVTSARPQQIRRLFRNSRLVGKRFLVVNVFFGSNIVEVSTFRRTPWENGVPTDPSVLLLSDDNVFGTAEEDAQRRDFTINALLYDPYERMVIDYVNGIGDLQTGKIRTIGNPEVRFVEDPIRIIRALKLKARLNFEMVPETYDALIRHVPLLVHSSIPRLILELGKILRGGVALPCFLNMAETSIFSVIAPDLQKICKAQSHPGYVMLKNILGKLDKLSQDFRGSLSDTTLFSCIFYSMLVDEKGTVSKDTALLDKISALAQNFHISKRLQERIAKVINVQPYFDPEQNKKIKKLFRTTYFQDALDFLRVRSQNSLEIYEFWQKRYKNRKRK